MQSEPFVSVIVLNYNGKNYLKDCIASVLKNSYSNFELILVDNASTDNSLKTAEQAFSDIRLKIVRSPRNLGFSGGNNLGYQASRGQYIVFLNNDTVVESEWLFHLVNAMQSDPTIGLAQSKILMFGGDRIQTAGWLFSNYLVRKHPLGADRSAEEEFEAVFEVPVASGASMIASRALLEEVGLFDDKVPFFYDDTLLSFKTWLSGRRVVTAQRSRIRHMMGASSAWNVEKTTFNLQKAKTCLTFDVYYGLGDLARASIINFVYTGVNSLVALKNSNLPVVTAHIKAYFWALGNLRFLWQNRLLHWSKTKLTPEALKEKFVRVNAPVAFYLLPSRLGNDFFSCAVECYERSVLKHR